MKKLHLFSIILLFGTCSIFSMRDFGERPRRASSYQDLSKEGDRQLCHVLEQQLKDIKMDVKLSSDRVQKKLVGNAEQITSLQETVITLKETIKQLNDTLEKSNEIADHNFQVIFKQNKKLKAQNEKLQRQLNQMSEQVQYFMTALLAQQTHDPRLGRVQSSPRESIPLGRSPRTPPRKKSSKPPIPTSALGAPHKREAFAEWASFTSSDDSDSIQFDRETSDENKTRKKKKKKSKALEEIWYSSKDSIPTKSSTHAQKKSPRSKDKKKKRKKHRKKDSPRSKQIA